MILVFGDRSSGSGILSTVVAKVSLSVILVTKFSRAPTVISHTTLA